MPLARSITASLAVGEIDPLARPREDVSAYYVACKRLENAVTVPQGGARRRGGFPVAAYQRGAISAIALGGATVTAANGGTAANLTDGDATTLLETGSSASISGITNASPAVVTTGAAHGFSTGDSVRIDGVSGLEASSAATATITGITQANPAVVTAAAHGFQTGDRVLITGVTGMVSINDTSAAITVVDANSFSLDGVDSSAYAAYVSGGTATILEGGGVNAFSGAITVLTATTFELDGFDSSSLTSYSSGGTATKGIGTTAEYEVFRVDFGTETTVGLVDVGDLRIPQIAGDESVSVAVQSSGNGSTWTTEQAISVGNAAYDRRFARTPDTALGAARYWRLAVINSGDLEGATVECSGLAMWTEAGYSASGASVGAVKAFRMTAEIGAEYMLVLTANNVDVFKFPAMTWQAAIAVPHAEAQVETVTNAARVDIMNLYHEDVITTQVRRLGTDSDWTAGAYPFESVPDYPFSSGAVSGGVNERQYFDFESMSTGDRFTFEFAGEVSPEVVWDNSSTVYLDGEPISTGSSDPNDGSAAMKTAMEYLSGITSVSFSKISSGNYEAEFTGVDGKKAWPIIVVNIISGGGSCTVQRKAYGKPDTAKLWSATRGYARCGCYYQGRHWMGGFKSAKDVISGSRVGNPLDHFEDADPVDNSPIVTAPDADESLSIQFLHPGRHLQIFASAAEMYVPDEPITPDNIAIKMTTRHGCGQYAQPVGIDGGTLFVDASGRTVREMLFVQQSDGQTYTAEPISLLSGHLVSDPRSLAFQPKRGPTSPPLLLLANVGADDEGVEVPAAWVSIMREQNVTGFARQETTGRVQQFAASRGGDAAAITWRELAGNAWNFIERVDPDYLSDAGIKVSASGSVIDVSDAPWLEGQTVQVHADGIAVGEFPVSSLSVDISPDTVTAEAEVGLRMVPDLVLLPFKGKGQQSPTMEKQRIFRALLSLYRTSAVAVGIEGETLRRVGLEMSDTGTFDPAADDLLFTGLRRVSGISGWRLEPCLRISQIDPMPWHVRAATFDLKF